MLHSYILSLALLFSILVHPIVSQSTLTFGFCFTDSSKAGSPYGPWSVATWGTLVVNASGYITAVDQHGGGGRYGYNVLSASMQRVQNNRDGTQSTATLGLCPIGTQGSDNILYNDTKPTWTDWNGICFSVRTSSDSPVPGSSNWILFPNDFPTQQIEIYYDLPALTYPSEYHTDNSTNGLITITPNAVAPPTCTPAAISTPLVNSALTYQFCYQAYAAAQRSTPAWQVSIQGTFLTNTSVSVSTISGQSGLFIYQVTGTRTQLVAGGAPSSVHVVGQTWHNSGTTIADKNEYNDDPLLLANAPYLVPGYGLVLYTDKQFTYPNGSLSAVNNQYALVNADPLVVSGSSVVEQQSPTPDFSSFAVSCSCSQMTCPLITSSSAASTSTTASASCTAVSKSTTAATCTSGGSGGGNGAARLTGRTAPFLSAALAVSAVMVL